jgi:hypothetical protein
MYMIPYFIYLLYVGAVIVFCILVLRRETGRKDLAGVRPDAVAVALLRGGLGAVLETVVFCLYVQKKIDLTTNGPAKKLQVVISKETTAGLSALERAAVTAFAALPGKVPNCSQHAGTSLLLYRKPKFPCKKRAGGKHRPAGAG